ncbi:ImmA/IrrE family metallo-endopeptidase [Lentibacillus populi]|nr:ImmA/IrrE family metallo-endopeptidase [Lentibacillus populi]
MHTIANKLGLEISYDEEKIFYCDNEINLKRSTKMQEWFDFVHELCHYLRHCGSQINMHPLFRQLQEYQADYFTYHFCIPTFMLDNLFNYTIYDIMILFNVDYEFAFKRLEMYKNKLLLTKGII